MKIDLSVVDRNQFMCHTHLVGDEMVMLIQPTHIGVVWEKDTEIFRSSVWDMSGNLISASYKKFYNWGEKPHLSPPPTSLKGAHLIEKVDGCLHADTLLNTDSGTKTIKEICESKFSGKVLVFCHKTKKQKYSKIISHSVKSNNGDWYELELENGNTIKLTGNHKVWLPDLECYRRVDELEVGVNFLLKK